ncbi:hypothetical protein FRC12_002656 [Ceratobasidium sp. 428]|nr:hypothetical protein FRC12_002656 [Ceratobasidium sp. 428]
MLKNTSSNRHAGGEREMTLARTFHERRECITRLSKIANDKNDILTEWAEYMLRLDYTDSRGTVDTETIDAHDTIQAPTIRSKPVCLQSPQAEALYEAFKRAQPNIPVRRALFEHGSAPVLEKEVYPIREVQHKGRIFSMSSFRNSIIKASVVENGELVERVGEIINMWEHRQPTSCNASVTNAFVLVRWYKASTIFAPRPVKLWMEDFPDLDIEIYVPDEYLERQAIIPVNDIHCHCARMSAKIDGTPVWLAIGLDRE